MNGTELLPLATKIIACTSKQEQLRLFNSCEPRFRDLLKNNIYVMKVQAYLAKQRKQAAHNVVTQVKPSSTKINHRSSPVFSQPKSHLKAAPSVAKHYLADIRQTLQGAKHA